MVTYQKEKINKLPPEVIRLNKIFDEEIDYPEKVDEGDYSY